MIPGNTSDTTQQLRRNEADAPKRSEPVRTLTAVRGIAAWWIVAFHFREAIPAGMPAGMIRVIDRGYLAVDLFFILSGYVISFNYLTWFTQGGFEPAKYARFLSLRLSRIYPVHGCMLLLFLLNPIAVLLFSSHPDVADLHWSYYSSSLLLVQNWGLTPGLYWNVPAWSISAEWLAYLTFPLLATISMVFTQTAMRSLVFIVSILALLAIASAILSPEGLGHGGQEFWSLRCLLEFTIGIGIGRACQFGPRSRYDTRLALMIAAVCIGIYGFAQVSDYYIMPIAFSAVVYAFIDERGLLPMILRGKTLQYLGTVSYSTYMVHYFLKIWTKFVFVGPDFSPLLAFPVYALAVLAGSMSLYHLVERPGQQIARRYLTRHAGCKAL